MRISFLDLDNQKRESSTQQTLVAYKEFLRDVHQTPYYNEPESFLNLPFDENIIKESLGLKEKLNSKKNIKYFILIGIGGSSLGTKALYDALYLQRKNPEEPKLIILDTINPEYLNYVKNLISEERTKPEEIIINVVSKSGDTLESITNFEFLVVERPELLERLVVTTAKNTPLWTWAERKRFNLLEIPHSVAGRFSVFSHVGIFPLACLNINLVALLEGAMAATQDAFNNTDNNLTLKMSVLVSTIQKPIYDTFIFNENLESLGKWYRQLYSETLGKKSNSKFPNFSLSMGTNDLHSVLQLYLADPTRYFTNFIISSRDVMDDEFIPDDRRTTRAVVKELTNRSLKLIRTSLQKSVIDTYREYKIPFIITELDDVTEKELGYFMQSKMIETIYTAKFSNVDTFNQPEVESYKRLAKKLLA